MEQALSQHAPIEERSNGTMEPDKALTDWQNEPSIRDLKQNYEDAANEHQTHISDVARWLDNLHCEGAAKANTKKGRSAIVPKVIRKQAEWRYAALTEPFLSTDDLFNATPVTYEDKQAAEQNQLILNNQFNTKINKVAFIDEYVRTAVDEGTVILRFGWNFDEEVQKVLTPQYEFEVTDDPEVQQVYAQIAALIADGLEREIEEHWIAAFNMAQEEQTFLKPIFVGEIEEEIVKVIANHPTVEICDYRSVTIDPSCNGDISKAQFVVFSFETSLAELEKSGRYTNLEQINVENASILGDPDHVLDKDNSSFNFNDTPRKRFVAKEYWGYWDIDGDGTLKPFVATWVGDTLIRMEMNPFPDKKLPFHVVPYLPVRKSVYGEPDGELLEDNQKVIGAVTRGMIDVMARSANGQMGHRKDALDVTNRRKFERGDDYEYNGGVDPRLAFHMHTYPEIPQSAGIMLEMQNAEAESLTGVKAYNSGISSQALGDVAAGIRGALDAASKRELGILRRLADGIVETGKRFIAMNSEFLSEEEVVRVTNDNFVKISRDDLQGLVDLKLSISTAEEDNSKAQELSFMLQTIGPNEDPAIRRMLLADISKLRKMPDLAKKIEEYEPEPDPVAEEIKQLQVELLKAQIESTRAQSFENLAEADLDSARADNIRSDTDLKDLEYVQTESGVAQERELQKMDHQVESNMALESLKAKLKLLEGELTQ